MATEWARDGTGQMLFPTNGNGAQALVSNLEDVAAIKIPAVLLFVLGEWKLDESLGFNWPSIWAQKNPIRAVVQAQFRRAILGITVPPGATPLVASVDDLAVALNPLTRAFQYSAEVTLANGSQTTITGVTP